MIWPAKGDWVSELPGRRRTLGIETVWPAVLVGYRFWLAGGPCWVSRATGRRVAVDFSSLWPAPGYGFRAAMAGEGRWVSRDTSRNYSIDTDHSARHRCISHM